MQRAEKSGSRLNGIEAMIRVWYDILAFSRPRQIFAKLGYPLSSLLQKRFAECSKAAMVETVS
jgi:uncharacterized protein (UPF0548 family)